MLVARCRLPLLQTAPEGLPSLSTYSKMYALEFIAETAEYGIPNTTPEVIAAYTYGELVRCKDARAARMEASDSTCY